MFRAFVFLEFNDNEWDLLLCVSILIGSKIFQLDKYLPSLMNILFVMKSSKSLTKIISKGFWKVGMKQIILLE